MRVNALRLTAFGPFAGEQEVDFDALGADGLFLISGPTGAGKTTILDALGFALYGTVPGARSDAEDYRSHYAPPGVPTVVEVEFTAHGRRYRVRRTPRYMRPKKRGTGMTEAKPSCELLVRNPQTQQWDGLGRTAAEVQPEIQRVLGLNAAQFMQIVLLPQGEFARFLRADPIEREPILRRLFATEHFTAVERILEERARASRAELERISQERLHTMRQAVALCAEDLALPDVAHPTPADVDAVCAAAGAVCAEQHAALGAVAALAAGRAEAARDVAQTAEQRLTGRQRLTALRARQQKYADAAAERTALQTQQEQATAAAALLPVQQEAARAQSAARKAAEQQQSTELKLQTALEHLPEHPAAGAAEDLVRYAEEAARAARAAAGHLRRREELEAQQEQTAAALATLTEQLTELNGRAAADEESLTGLTEKLEASSSLEVSRERLRTRIAAATNCRDLHARQQRAARAEEAAAEDRDELRASEEEAQAEYARVRAARLAGIASEIAAELEDGQACRVCGSLTHPQPAQPGEQTVAKETEEEALRAWTAAQQRSNAARSALAEAAALRRTLAEQLHAASRGLTDEDTTGGLPDDVLSAAAVQQLIEALEEKLAAVSEELAELTAARARRDALARTLAAHAQQRTDLEGQIAAHQQRLAGIAGQLEHIGAVLSGDHAAALAEFGISVPQDAESAAHTAEELEALAATAAALSEATAAADRTATESARRSKAFDDAFDSSIFDTAEQLAAAARIDAHGVQARLRDFADEAARIDEATAQDWYAAAAADDADEEILSHALDTAREQMHRAEADARHLTERTAVAAQRRDDLAELRTSFRTHAAGLEETLAAHRGDVALDGIVRATSPDNHRRLPLSAYALLSLFVDVAHNASDRLQTMSAGRFTLIHDLALHRKEKRAGLGLQVLDTFTDEPRDPRSLSGGETFMASLALALGLADTVAAAAGGIRLDSLFIDEGFGSLDPDTLAQVLAVLDSLRSGGRCVGVISHVQSMLQTIPEQLHIQRSPTGSTMRRISGSGH